MDLADYYKAVGFFRASGLDEAQTHGVAEKMFTPEEEGIMAAFTEDQIKIIEAAFDHMWARMEVLHDNINEDSVRLAALIDVLHTKGAITHEQVKHIIHIFHMEASEKRNPAKLTDMTEQQITRQILKGDLSAFDRVREREDKSCAPSS